MAKNSQPWEPKWKTRGELGKGGQGATSLVESASEPGAKGVLKVLRNNKSPQARGRMYREVVNLQTLSSLGAAVPRVLDHNAADYDDLATQLYVVMEYIPGKTLTETLKESGPLPLDVAARLILELCKTVEIAHNSQVLHRDLKPDNLIVRDLAKPEIVVVDYGLSFNVEQDEPMTQTDETFRNKFLDLPETNTPGGNRRDARSDVTAVCGLLYFALTGHVPGQLQGGDGRPPHMRSGYSLREKISNEPRLTQLETFFDRGFSPSMENRFQTIQELGDRLRSLLSQQPTNGIEDPVVVAVIASRRLRRMDRTTQLRDFQRNAESLVNEVPKYIGTVSARLERFCVSASFESAFPLPAGIDRVIPTDFGLQINAAHHNNLRVFKYTVGSRGTQCVLLRLRMVRGSDNAPLKADGEWKEVLWYNGDDVPDPTPAIDDVKSCLVDAIRELEAEITGS